MNTHKPSSDVTLKVPNQLCVPIDGCFTHVKSFTLHGNCAHIRTDFIRPQILPWEGIRHGCYQQERGEEDPFGKGNKLPQFMGKAFEWA